MGQPVQHRGLWWSTDSDGLIVWRRDNTEEWKPWDPDEVTEGPPPGLTGPPPRDPVASGINAIYWLILAIAVIVGGIFIVNNLSNAQDQADREACEIVGGSDC